MSRGLRLVGTNPGDADPRTFIPRLNALHRQRRLPVEKLVTSFAFDDINAPAKANTEGHAVEPVFHMA